MHRGTKPRRLYSGRSSQRLTTEVMLLFDPRLDQPTHRTRRALGTDNADTSPNYSPRFLDPDPRHSISSEYLWVGSDGRGHISCDIFNPHGLEGTGEGRRSFAKVQGIRRSALCLYQHLRLAQMTGYTLDTCYKQKKRPKHVFAPQVL